jgi:hypothetical protein
VRSLMPGRASSTPKPNWHRTSNSISASRGRRPGKTRPRRPQWGGSCPGSSGRPSAAGRVTPGIPRRAIPIISGRFSGTLRTKFGCHPRRYSPNCH